MLPAQDPDLSAGTIFQGGYEILAPLGAGSSGRVYKARQLSTGQAVAIKILRPASADAPAALARATERFRREMRVCAELTHPNIVRLIDSGESAEGVLYAVFQYVPGATLEEVLAAEGKLGLQETLRLMTQVLDALSCAHARGIVHRDLKPANIIILETGARRNAMVLDFGLGGFMRAPSDHEARGNGEVMGTPRYVAPEQLRGELPSSRADLYSWGLVFLECLTGEPAVGGTSSQEIIRNQLSGDPIVIPPAFRDHRLGHMLRTVTAKEIEKRDVTIAGLLEVLDTAESIAPPQTPAVAERRRRQVTVVCCRFVVEADGDEPLDLEELDQVLHAQQAMCEAVAGGHGGRRAAAMADRIVLVFGYPQARENDARQAARAAQQIAAEIERVQAPLLAERRLHMTVHTGVHTGVVVVPEMPRPDESGLDDLLGLTPQIAERLTDLAAGGEVVVSVDTRRLLGAEVGADAAGECRPSGLRAPIPAFRLRADARRGARGGIAPTTSETRLVGRAEQLAALLEGWRRACDAQGSAVVLSGEPGIGKSRLLRELRRRIPEDAWLECTCAAEDQNTPLRPVVDVLTGADQSLEGLLSRYGLDLDQNVPLFSALLSIPLGERYAPLFLSAERQKELTLEGLRTLLLKMCDERPRVLAIENLHWSDPTTLELAGQIVNEIHVTRGGAAPRLYLVFTTRPDFAPPWPTEHVARMLLPRLARAEVEEMVTAGAAGGHALSAAVLKRVFDLADGVPLFVEELSRVLLEPGTGSAPAGRSLTDAPAIEIPGSLRDLLSARLDILSSGARESAQLAAALGREFRHELLRVVSSKDETALHDDLAELTATGLVSPRGSGRGAGYLFRHALIRDAAYDSMTRETRQGIHRRIARTLRERYPELEQGRPELLAQHFERGGEIDTAATYWHRAGARAIERADYAVAMTLLDKGLVLLRALSPTTARRRQEVELLATLGTAHIATRGYAAPEVEKMFGEAWELCEALGDDIPLDVLQGIWGVHVTRSNRETTAALIPRFRRIVEHSTDSRALLKAHSCIGTAAFYDGDFPTAHSAYVAGRRLFDRDDFVRAPRAYALGGDFYVYGFGAAALWQLGYPDQAQALCKEMFALVERARDPYATCMAIGLALTVAHDRGECDRELELAGRLLAIAAEQRMLLWTAVGLSEQGGALVLRGQPEDAIGLIRQGLDLFQLIGLITSFSYYHVYLADAYREAGRVPEGLETVNEALALTEAFAARFHAPELWRLKGELLLLQGDSVGAEENMRRALAAARRQSARCYELRAAISLSHLLADRHDRHSAREALAATSTWFTEGFETVDLRRGRALLDELA